MKPGLKCSLPALALALALPVLAQAPARPEPQGESAAGASRSLRPDDAAITAAVEQALRKLPGFDTTDVRVQTYAGTVRLMGWVDQASQRYQAAEAARAVPGVEQVQNSLEVK